MKFKKKGVVGLLANPYVLIGLIILVGIFALSINGGKFLSILNPSLSFAGKNWVIEQQEISCPFKGSVDYKIEGEFLVLNSASSGSQSQGCNGPAIITASTDITNDDEILVLLDGYGTASAGGISASGSYDMFAKIADVNGNEIWQSKGISASARGPTSTSATFEPQIFAFKNNFDGTWSSIQSFGIGDVFIKKETKAMTPPIRLHLGSVSSVGLADGSASASGFSRFYNVVFKENAFAVCKADEVGIDANNDGRVTSDECQQLENIL